jgi:hypothetical protein
MLLTIHFVLRGKHFKSFKVKSLSKKVIEVKLNFSMIQELEIKAAPRLV